MLRKSAPRALAAPAVLAALAAVASLAGPQAIGQGLPPSLRACMAEPDDARRLACFDREAAQLGPQSPATATAAASGAAPATATPTATPEPLTAEQRFGFRGEVAREAIAEKKAAVPQLERLESTVTAVARRGSIDWIVTLENGQQWAQISTGTPYTIRVGDAVTINPGALGSFLLTGPSGRATRVRRAR
jgi:hypothetical protein